MPPFDLVLDTNAVLNLTSINDLIRSVEKENVDEIDLQHNYNKMGATLLLMLGCLDKGLCAGVVEDELRKLIDESIDKHTLESAENDYGVLMAHFVLDLITPCPLHLIPGVPEGLVANNKDDDVDDWITEYAKKHGIPLVTNEGWGMHSHREGAKKGKLRHRAKKAGATVFSTDEWNEQFIKNPDDLFTAFFAKFDKKAPGTVAERKSKFPTEKSAEELEVIRAILKEAAERTLA